MNMCYFIYDNYYQTIPEVTDAENNLKLNLPGVYLQKDPAFVNGMSERKALVVELTKMLQQMPIAEKYYKQAAQDYEAGYADYDANSKAYILDHALSSVDDAINLLAPYADFTLAKDYREKFDSLRVAIVKEHPRLS